MGGTVSWGQMYGPSGGQAVSQKSTVDMASGITDRLPLTLPVLVLIGVLAWWALEKWD